MVGSSSRVATHCRVLKNQNIVSEIYSRDLYSSGTGAKTSVELGKIKIIVWKTYNNELYCSGTGAKSREAALELMYTDIAIHLHTYASSVFLALEAAFHTASDGSFHLFPNLEILI